MAMSQPVVLTDLSETQLQLRMVRPPIVSGTLHNPPDPTLL